MEDPVVKNEEKVEQIVEGAEDSSVKEGSEENSKKEDAKNTSVNEDKNGEPEKKKAKTEDKDKNAPPGMVWNRFEGRYIREDRAGISRRRRENQIHRAGPKNRSGVLGTINKHGLPGFKIPQVMTVIARVCNFDACKLKYEIKSDGFTGEGMTTIFTSHQPVRSMSCFVKVTPDDFDSATFDPHNLGTPEGKYPQIEREKVIGNYTELTEKDVNGDTEEDKDGEEFWPKREGKEEKNDKTEEEKGNQEEEKDDEEEKEERDQQDREKGDQQDGEKGSQTLTEKIGSKEKKPFPWLNPARERLSLIYQGPDGFKVNGITCLKAHFAEKEDPSVLVPGSPEEFYMVQLEHEKLFSLTSPVSPFPDDEDCVRVVVIPTEESGLELNNGDLLGHVVLLKPKDVFSVKWFNINTAFVLSTLWNPDPPKFLTKEMFDETLKSEAAQAIIKEKDAEHAQKMIEEKSKAAEGRRRRRREYVAERFGEKRDNRGWKQMGPERQYTKRFRYNDPKAPRSASTRMPWDSAPDVSQYYSSAIPKFGRGGYQHQGPRYDSNRDRGFGMKGFGTYGNGRRGGDDYDNSYGQDYGGGQGYGGDDGYNYGNSNYGNSGW